MSSNADNVIRMRNDLLKIMLDTEARFRITLKKRSEKGASGVIKNTDQDHYVFDGGHHLPVLTKEASEKNRITFTSSKGQKSGYVNFYGPFKNDWGKHVELRSEAERKEGTSDTAYHRIQEGDSFNL